MFVFMYLFLYVDLCVYMHLYIQTHIYVYLSVCLSIYMYIRISGLRSVSGSGRARAVHAAKPAFTATSARRARPGPGLRPRRRPLGSFGQLPANVVLNRYVHTCIDLYLSLSLSHKICIHVYVYSTHSHWGPCTAMQCDGLRP